MLGGEARGREICSLDVSFLNNKQERDIHSCLEVL